jgi:hypothetical protein
MEFVVTGSGTLMLRLLPYFGEMNYMGYLKQIFCTN